MWLNVHKRIGLGRAGLCFGDEFPGRLPLLGKRFWAMGGPSCKKVSLCHLYTTLSCYLDLEWKLGHLRGREDLFRFLPDLSGN